MLRFYLPFSHLFFRVFPCASNPSHPSLGRQRKRGRGGGTQKVGGAFILLPVRYDWLKRDTYPTAPRPMGKRLWHWGLLWLVGKRLPPYLLTTNGIAALPVTSDFYFLFLLSVCYVSTCIVKGELIISTHHTLIYKWRCCQNGRDSIAMAKWHSAASDSLLFTHFLIELEEEEERRKELALEIHLYEDVQLIWTFHSNLFVQRPIAWNI